LDLFRNDPANNFEGMKRYKNRDQILKDIDRAHAKIRRLEKDAQSWLDEERLYEGTPMVSELRNARENADKFLKAIKYQKERRLKYLGGKLAEMDTMPLDNV
jgi:hypothetical protein